MYQVLVADWVRSTFGEDAMKDVPERALRLAEEAIELAQACGVNLDKLHDLVDYVFNRPVGQVDRELGGVALCFYACCEAAGVDANTTVAEELARVRSPEVIERCRRRQTEKRALFPTEGASPAHLPPQQPSVYKWLHEYRRLGAIEGMLLASDLIVAMRNEVSAEERRTLSKAVNVLLDRANADSAAELRQIELEEKNGR